MKPESANVSARANPYMPVLVRLVRSKIETEDRQLKSFFLQFVDPADRFDYLPGQFCQLSIFGAGEAPFGIASSPDEKELLFTVNRIGEVTTALHSLNDGDIIGIRGPLGKGYPVHLVEGKDVLIVGGGFAFTTLRSLLLYISSPGRRNNFGKIIVLYGVREPGLFLYREEFDIWRRIPNCDLILTVDREFPNWKERVGVVPKVLRDVNPKSENTAVFVCGPPIMLKFTFPVLYELGFDPEFVFVSLEMRMKCGIGKCGRCNIGHKYICKDGPVFSLAEYSRLPKDE